jgi:hypothetical protein
MIIKPSCVADQNRVIIVQMNNHTYVCRGWKITGRYVENTAIAMIPESVSAWSRQPLFPPVERPPFFSPMEYFCIISGMKKEKKI